MDLNDIDIHLLLDDLLQPRAQPVHFRTFPADDHAGAAAEERHANFLARALDLHARDQREGVIGLDEVAQSLVGDDERAEFLLAREPAGPPILGNPQPERYRVDFLTHVTSKTAVNYGCFASAFAGFSAFAAFPAFAGFSVFSRFPAFAGFGSSGSSGADETTR